MPKANEQAQIDFIADFENVLSKAGYPVEKNMIIDGKYRILTHWERVEILLKIAISSRKHQVAAVQMICEMIFGLPVSRITPITPIVFTQSPRKYYVYALINDDEEIIYIGKGTKKRAWQHLKRFDRSNPAKSRYINREFEQGREISVNILYDNLEENEAFDIEARLIKEHKAKSPIFNIKKGIQTRATSLIGYLRSLEDYTGISKKLEILLTTY